MKFKVDTKKEVQCDTVLIELPVRYDDEDIPYDFPFREHDMLSLEVNIGSGRIAEWPKSYGPANVFMKVCDEGTYTLFDQGIPVTALTNEYVPHGLVPGDHGDYVRLAIDESGLITNWPKHPDVSVFFEKDD